MSSKIVRAMAFAGMALASQSRAAAPPCQSIKALISDEMFRRYPASAPTNSHWQAPDVRFGRAHLYRTRIREDGAGPPDFGGHYRIAGIGCGAATICPAFVDRASGRVLFPHETRVVTALLREYDESPDGFDQLIHRRDSRLLVVLGTRNDDERTSGASLYDWRNDKLHLIRFIPEKDLCFKKVAA